MASRLTKDGHIDKRFKKSTSGCFLYFGILMIVVVFVIGEGYIDLEYLFGGGIPSETA